MFKLALADSHLSFKIFMVYGAFLALIPVFLGKECCLLFFRFGLRTPLYGSKAIDAAC